MTRRRIEQRTYPSHTTPVVAVPVPYYAVAACPYVVKRVLNAQNVKGLPRCAHTFEVLVSSYSVLQCSNCFSVSFQCLRGWFTRIMSNREFLFTTVSRRTACKSFVVWQKRDIPSAMPRLVVLSSLPSDRHYSSCSWNRPIFEVDRPTA